MFSDKFYVYSLYGKINIQIPFSSSYDCALATLYSFSFNPWWNNITSVEFHLRGNYLLNTALKSYLQLL